jgi:hypothetical protein
LPERADAAMASAARRLATASSAETGRGLAREHDVGERLGDQPIVIRRLKARLHALSVRVGDDDEPLRHPAAETGDKGARRLDEAFRADDLIEALARGLERGRHERTAAAGELEHRDHREIDAAFRIDVEDGACGDGLVAEDAPHRAYRVATHVEQAAAAERLVEADVAVRIRHDVDREMRPHLARLADCALAHELQRVRVLRVEGVHEAFHQRNLARGESVDDPAGLGGI